jgi:hypothetical protein
MRWARRLAVGTHDLPAAGLFKSCSLISRVRWRIDRSYHESIISHRGEDFERPNGTARGQLA